MRNFLILVGFIALLGLVGRMDYESEVLSHQIDEQNKQEVIKDIQLRCYTGDLTGELCRGF